MRVIEGLVQGSDAWLAARAGVISASKAGDLMARLKNGKPGASYENLVFDLAVERITGQKISIPQTPAMARGVELEPEARSAYEDQFFLTVEEVPMVLHPEHDFISCSPDGLVGDDGLVEIKCLGSKNHVQTLLSGYAAKTYRWQALMQIWICERAWCDLAAYNPDFPAHLQLHVERIERDDEAIAELEATCLKANEKIESIVNQLEKLK